MCKPILPDYLFRQSPNWNPREHKGQSFDVVGGVVHFTAGGNGPRTADWLCTPEARASAHFMGFRDGNVVQLVQLDRAAWHAGAARWLYNGFWTRNPNLFTWGVELANHGPLWRSQSGNFHYELGGKLYPYRGEQPVKAALIYPDGQRRESWWEPFPRAQIDGLHKLLEDLEREGWPTRLIGHEEIAVPMGRKQDPGPLFPWPEFSQYRGPWLPTTKAELLPA